MEVGGRMKNGRTGPLLTAFHHISPLFVIYFTTSRLRTSTHGKKSSVLVVILQYSGTKA